MNITILTEAAAAALFLSNLASVAACHTRLDARTAAQPSLAGVHALMRSADPMFDTISFSGFNTPMQAVETALIAEDDSAYNAVVTRVVEDLQFRARMPG